MARSRARPTTDHVPSAPLPGQFPGPVRFGSGIVIGAAALLFLIVAGLVLAAA